MAKVSIIFIILITVLAIMMFVGEAMAIASAFFTVFIALAIMLFRSEKSRQFRQREDQQQEEEEQEEYQANAYDWGCIEGYYEGYRDSYDRRAQRYEDPLFRYEYYRKSPYSRGHRRGYYEGYQDSYDRRTHRYEGISYYQNRQGETIRTAFYSNKRTLFKQVR